MTDTANRNVLIIGGHGKVAQLATPRLVSAGHDVTSLIRSPEQVPDIEALGSTPQVRDLTALRVEDWVELMRDMDVVIWSAGNGGRDGSSATYAIDRDGALALIDALTQLGEDAPRLLMVSYLGSLEHGVSPEDPFFPYADAKETVDRRLLDSDLDYLILAPSRLTMEPAGGIEVGDNARSAARSAEDSSTTSRELVAMVLTEMAGRDSLPQEKILPFVDADGGADAAQRGVEKL